MGQCKLRPKQDKQRSWGCSFRLEKVARCRWQQRTKIDGCLKNRTRLTGLLSFIRKKHLSFGRCFLYVGTPQWHLSRSTKINFSSQRRRLRQFGKVFFAGWGCHKVALQSKAQKITSPKVEHLPFGRCFCVRLFLENIFLFAFFQAFQMFGQN